MSMKAATGLLGDAPEDDIDERIRRRVEPTFFDEVGVQMEGSLQHGHYIVGNGVDTITVERPRSELIQLNADTKDWVNTLEEDPLPEELVGNVTRFNTVSRNGRCYSDADKRIIACRPTQEFTRDSDAFMTWSLHGNAIKDENKLKVMAKRVKSAGGRTKRLQILAAETWAKD